MESEKLVQAFLVTTADVSFAQRSWGSAVVVAKARLSTYVDGNNLIFVNKKLHGYSWISCSPKLRIVCLERCSSSILSGESLESDWHRKAGGRC